MGDQYPEAGEVWIRRGRRGPIARIYVVRVYEGVVQPYRNTSRRTQSISVQSLLAGYRREASRAMVTGNAGFWAGALGVSKHLVYREIEALRIDDERTGEQ